MGFIVNPELFLTLIIIYVRFYCPPICCPQICGYNCLGGYGKLQIGVDGASKGLVSLDLGGEYHIIS